jgi:hypothetical protein
MNSTIIGIVLFYFIFYHVEILKANCHKRKRMLQMKNLLLEFEDHSSSMQSQLFFLFLLTKRLGHIGFGKTLYTLGFDRSSCLAH